MSNRTLALRHPRNREKSVHVLFKDPLPLGRRPTTAIRIRPRLVVQAHPGPLSKLPVNTQLFSPFPSGEYLSRKQFANYLPTLRLAGWHHTQGVNTLRVKAERLASIRVPVLEFGERVGEACCSLWSWAPRAGFFRSRDQKQSVQVRWGSVLECSRCKRASGSAEARLVLPVS